MQQQDLQRPQIVAQLRNMKAAYLKPADKREAVEILIKEQQCSTSKACKIVQLPRSSYQY